MFEIALEIMEEASVYAEAEILTGLPGQKRMTKWEAAQR